MSALLVIDTATSTALVGLGDRAGAYLDERTWHAGHRHGEELLARADELLRAHGLEARSLAGIVVGTGPGAFTGSRVGLATAKGLAAGLGIPLAGVSTAAALLLAAERAGMPSPLALLLPAGPSDRVLVAGGTLVHLPGGREPDAEPGATFVALDLEGRAPADAVARGSVARTGLGPALLELGRARLDEGIDDTPTVVALYATLPRGVREERGEVAWSRDRR